jgi:hypothetical protein
MASDILQRASYQPNYPRARNRRRYTLWYHSLTATLPPHGSQATYPKISSLAMV